MSRFKGSRANHGSQIDTSTRQGLPRAQKEAHIGEIVWETLLECTTFRDEPEDCEITLVPDQYETPGQVSEIRGPISPIAPTSRTSDAIEHCETETMIS